MVEPRCDNCMAPTGWVPFHNGGVEFHVSRTNRRQESDGSGASMIFPKTSCLLRHRLRRSKAIAGVGASLRAEDALQHRFHAGIADLWLARTPVYGVSPCAIEQDRLEARHQARR